MTWVRFPSPAPLPLLRFLRLIVAWLLAAALAVMLAACGSEPAGQGEGIVSLAPAMTETVIALGEGQRLVAVSDYDQASAAAELPRVGTAMTPNFEAIARLRPGLVLLDQSGADYEPSLARLAPVLSLPWLTLEDIVRGVQAIGARIGRASEAAELAARLEATLDVPPPDGPRVLFVLDGPDVTQTWYLRANSIHGLVLHAAGARNAVPEAIDGAAVLAPEQLLAAAPEVIIVLAGRGEPDAVARAAAERFAALASLPAVADGRIGAVIGEGYLLPGPGILDLVGPLRAELKRLWQ